MAGLRSQTEGANLFVCGCECASTLEEVLNSIDGIQVSSIVDGSECFCRKTQRTFRWDEESFSTPSSSVILPRDVATAQPGRWILVGSGAGASPWKFIGSGVSWEFGGVITTGTTFQESQAHLFVSPQDMEIEAAHTYVCEEPQDPLWNIEWAVYDADTLVRVGSNSLAPAGKGVGWRRVPAKEKLSLVRGKTYWLNLFFPGRVYQYFTLQRGAKLKTKPQDGSMGIEKIYDATSVIALESV